MTTHAELGLDDLLEALGQVELFSDLAQSERLRVMDLADVLHIEAGEVLVEEGTTGAELFVLLSGEASVLVDLEGDRIEVAKIQAGDTLGELGLLLGEPRLATVLATKPLRALRIDQSVLEKLVAEVPGFSIAFARDLARRLRVVLGDTAERVAESRAGKVVVAAQDLSRMRSYMTRYYATAVKNTVRKHRLLVSKEFPRYECAIRITGEDQGRWFELFDISEGQRQAPLSYYVMSGTMLLMKVVEDVGVNFKHLRHLRSEHHFAADGTVLQADVEYRLSAVLAEIIPMGEDKVVLAIEMRLEDPDRVVVQMATEYFVILNIEPEDLEALRSARTRSAADTPDFAGISKLEPSLGEAPGVRASTIDVPDDMGMRYGKVSGDLNMVHTTRTAAKLFGHPKPFIQGTCTANYVVKELSAAADPGHLVQVDVTFTRPLYVGQTVVVRHDEERFEVCDAKGKLVALGSWRATAPPL